MAAKGQQFKKEVQTKILEAFPGSFLYNGDKEIRISGTEDGVEVQIKVALTCAKENVTCGADTALPGDFPAPVTAAPTPARSEPVAPTAEEKQNVTNLLRSLGL